MRKLVCVERVYIDSTIAERIHTAVGTLSDTEIHANIKSALEQIEDIRVKHQEAIDTKQVHVLALLGVAYTEARHVDTGGGALVIEPDAFERTIYDIDTWFKLSLSA